MLFSKTAVFIAVGALSSLVHAQTPTANAAAPTATIMVGSNGLQFTPDNLSVKKGSWVRFEFVDSVHSVERSSFDKPCQPLADGGFYSGDLHGSSPPGTFEIYIADEKPIWYYCATGAHCQSGMNGVINIDNNSPDTLEAYNTAAKGATSDTVNTPFGGILDKDGSGSGKPSTLSGINAPSSAFYSAAPSASSSSSSSSNATSSSEASSTSTPSKASSAATPSGTHSAASCLVVKTATLVFGAAVALAFFLV